ncbi:MAG: PLP-dependent aminotransferase family protein [Lachnospiraceae bacterium]|nr:PLP-dependent aminotransferase family protein [Lachnospiraceae bacterium]
MNELTIPLKENGGEHLYQQIYNHIKNEIRKGNLPAGWQLPSTRALAAHLSVSRSTVDLAYEQLLSEGYIESVPHKGHFVCEITGLYLDLEGKEEKKAESPERLHKPAFDFSPNSVDMSGFPFATWKKISKAVFLDEEREVFELGDPKGDLRLREVICRYLHNSRGVICRPEQIIVGAGNDYLLSLLQKLLGEGKKVAVENPAYMRAARIFASEGCQVVPISLDDNGMRIDLLQESGAQIAYITPSRQFPTGIVMPIGRRMELLSWAKEEKERYIIEDDYDSEFRYKGKPIPSLQASDRMERVVYLGTFSKAIAPAIRISYMVLPGPLLKIYEEKLWFLSSTVSRIDQAILYRFMENGHFERYLNKMRKVYKGKHDLLLACLKPFHKAFRIEGEHAGLHVLLVDKRGFLEEELLSLAKAADCRVYGMSGYRLDDLQDVKETEIKTPATLVIGYGGLTEKQIKDGIERLKKAWQI